MEMLSSFYLTRTDVKEMPQVELGAREVWGIARITKVADPKELYLRKFQPPYPPIYSHSEYRNIVMGEYCKR